MRSQSFSCIHIFFLSSFFPSVSSYFPPIPFILPSVLVTSFRYVNSICLCLLSASLIVSISSSENQTSLQFTSFPHSPIQTFLPRGLLSFPSPHSRPLLFFLHVQYNPVKVASDQRIAYSSSCLSLLSWSSSSPCITHTQKTLHLHLFSTSRDIAMGKGGTRIYIPPPYLAPGLLSPLVSPLTAFCLPSAALLLYLQWCILLFLCPSPLLINKVLRFYS